MTPILAVMSPTGGIALLFVAVAAVAMVVYAIMQGSKNKMAHTSEQDLVRRVKLTIGPEKAEELAKHLGNASEVVKAKKARDETPEKASCYVDDVNGYGPTLVEILVKRG